MGSQAKVAETNATLQTDSNHRPLSKGVISTAR